MKHDALSVKASSKLNFQLDILLFREQKLGMRFNIGTVKMRYICVPFWLTEANLIGDNKNLVA